MQRRQDAFHSPEDTVGFPQFNGRARALTLAVEGRTIDEAMEAFWPGARDDESLPDHLREYGEIGDGDIDDGVIDDGEIGDGVTMHRYAVRGADATEPGPGTS